MKTSTDLLSFKPYREVLERVQIQFDLLRFALKTLKPKDRKRFFTEVAAKKLAHIEKVRAVLKQQKGVSDEHADQIANDLTQRTQSELRRERRAGNLYATSEFTEDRLNQSELLLLVAHFESFMKVVHERFLIAGPGKVFGKGFRDDQNSKIPLKDIFDSTQNGWNAQKFLNELIAKEVKWLDAQNITVKADYFDKHFGIPFGSATDIEDLKSIMRRRNHISHEVYDPPKGHEHMLKETLEHGNGSHCEGAFDCEPETTFECMSEQTMVCKCSANRASLVKKWARVGVSVSSITKKLSQS